MKVMWVPRRLPCQMVSGTRAIHMYYLIRHCNYYRRGDYIRWVEQLPDSQTPSWLGLPNNAEKVLLTKRGKRNNLKL